MATATTAAILSSPVAGCDVSQNKNGRAEPSLGRLNDNINIIATGFRPGEPIFLSFLTPTGEVRASEAPIEGAVNPDGSLAIEPIAITPDVVELAGRWKVTIVGAASNARSEIFFCVAPQ